MRRQHVGQAAHFAPAHGVRLARERKRPHAGLADAPCRQMAVDDAVDLVRAGGRLVHALRKGRDDLARGGKRLVKRQQGLRVDLADARHLQRVAAVHMRGRQRRVEVAAVPRDESLVDHALARQVAQQAVEQPHVGARLHGQMDIGQLAGGRAARVDHHQFHLRAGFADAGDALEQDRMAPGRVRAHQHDHVGQFQVFIAARHDILAERALVARHCRRHAQARIGVDVRAAHIALHELVGHVIIFRQQLARDIQRDGIGAVCIDDGAQAAGHPVQRGIPGSPPQHAVGAHLRLQQPVLQVQRLAQGRAFHAQAPQVGRVRGVSGDADGAIGQACRFHAAADAAIRASGFHGRAACHGMSCQAAWPHRAWPNNKWERSWLMSRRCWIRSKYQGPSCTSPYSTAPTRRLPCTTRRL